MKTPTHPSKRSLVHVLAATLAAFMLLLSIAPGADAQTRDKDTNTAVLAATKDCPDGFKLGRFGCQPENLTSKQPGIRDTGGDCPDLWVPSSAPGGCSPGYFTLKLVGLEFDNGCPTNWVPSSAPGGCSPGFITSDPGPQIFHAQHHCAFGAACDPMIAAVIALGGHCVDTPLGTTCELPSGPAGRD